MGDMIIALQSTPVPTILVVGGLVFLFLAVVGQFVGEITVPKERQMWAGLIGCLLLFSGVALYVVPVSPSVPTPTIVAAVTPDTPTPMAIVAPTDTPTRKPTDTPAPKPPTNTPVPKPTNTPTPKPTPKPTNTPTPTNTPRPTPTPTATIDADPTVYDNFNNPANDGGYNEGLWRQWIEPPGGQYQVAQQDGVMMFAQQGRPEQGIELAALEYYKISLKRSTFFEARMMLSPEAKDSNVVLYLIADLPANEQWSASCAVCNWGEPNAGCMDILIWQEERSYKSEYIPHQLGSWHTVRMEVDPATMTFSYFVDGQPVGSHIPLDADKLKTAKFTLAIGIWGTMADAVTGYVDDVRVGPVQ